MKYIEVVGSADEVAAVIGGMNVRSEEGTMKKTSTNKGRVEPTVAQNTGVVRGPYKKRKEGVADKYVNALQPVVKRKKRRMIKLENSFKPWSREDEVRMVHLRKEKIPFAVIAKQLGRTVKSCRQRDHQIRHQGFSA